MHGSSVFQSEKVLSLFSNGREPFPLAAGEIVSAEVLGMGAGNTVSVRMKNAVLDVQTDFAVRQGDLLALRVEKEEDALYLTLAEGAGRNESSGNGAPDLVRFEKLTPAAVAMIRLVSLLSRLPGELKAGLPEIDIINRFLPRIEHLSGKSIKDMIEDGGVFFESKLRILAYGLDIDGGNADIKAGRIIAGDLKASLLRLKDMLLDPEARKHFTSHVSAGELLTALNNVLQNIEYYQLLSKLTDSLHFFLPFLWPQLQDGSIVMREYGHGKEGERSYIGTVSLDLERTGRVRVDLIFKAGYLRVMCAVADSGYFHLFQDGIEALQGQFKAAGVRLGHLSVRYEPELKPYNDRECGGASIVA